MLAAARPGRFMFGPYVHRIDPIVASVAGVHLWWYGLGFALGFLQLHRFLVRRHASLGLSRREAWSLTLFMVVGVLGGGRLVEVAFDEWPFYREHLRLIPAYWLGGMATHGLLLGAAAAAGLFAVLYRKPFLILADALVIPGAFLMGVGRIGNFIDGQIVGSVTDVWWAVKFPDAEGFRHPVVLYDGAKNLLLMLFLLRVRRTNPTPGATAARFVFWYAFPRIVIDLFRDYPTHRLALGTGQTLNLLMALLGLVLLFRSRLRRLGRLRGRARTVEDARPRLEQAPLASQRIAFAALMAFCLTIPSNWTQDIPARYGARHPGLRHSWWYPAIDTAPRGTPAPPSSRWGPPCPGVNAGELVPRDQELQANSWLPGGTQLHMLQSSVADERDRPVVSGSQSRGIPRDGRCPFSQSVSAGAPLRSSVAGRTGRTTGRCRIRPPGNGREGAVT